MKKLVLLCFVALSISVVSCSKNEVPTSELNNPEISLQEFLASIGDDEKGLLGNELIDNSNYKTNSLTKLASTKTSTVVEDGALEATAFEIKFRWHGTGSGGGCDSFIGICITIPINYAESNQPEPNALLTRDGDKLIIQPTTDENGLTSDGYLPVGFYVPVGDDYLIKPGIYKGNSDRIVVDLIPLN